MSRNHSESPQWLSSWVAVMRMVAPSPLLEWCGTSLHASTPRHLCPRCRHLPWIEGLFGGLDRHTTIGVVHYHPDELLGLDLGGSDHEPIGWSWLRFSRKDRHDKTMTTILGIGQTTIEVIPAIFGHPMITEVSAYLPALEGPLARDFRHTHWPAAAAHRRGRAGAHISRPDCIRPITLRSRLTGVVWGKTLLPS
jgi:hypothetical protein